MSTPERNESEVASKRKRASWILTGVGLAALLGGVLHMTSSTIGGRVERFSERRTYNQVKVKMREAFPVTVALGLGGLGLMLVGARLRK